MISFTNIYTYSKEKTISLIQYIKPVKVVKEEKKESGWIKQFYKKYEKTQNTSYEYVMCIYNTIKRKGRTTFVSFAFSKFNEKSEYNSLPWYQKLFLILKYQICRFFKIENSKSSVISNESVEGEEETHRNKLNEWAEHDFSIDETNTKHTSSNESTFEFISFRNSKKWKSINSEGTCENVNSSVADKKNSMNYNLFSQNRTMSFFNNFLLFDKNNITVTENKDEDINKTEEKNNNTEEMIAINENISDKVSLKSDSIEDISFSNEKASNLAESGILNNIKFFNFRNALIEINKHIF